MKIIGVRKRFYIPPLIGLLCAYIIAAFSPNVEATSVYGVLPVFVYYTDQTVLADPDTAATCKGLLVIINSQYKGCKETLKHELVHAEQAYRHLLFHWLPCYISGDYLAKAEAEAYGRTGMSSEQNAKTYAEMIRDEYSPNTDVEQIERQLVYYWRLEHVHTDS